MDKSDSEDRGPSMTFQRPGHIEHSPVERLLGEFEAHEHKERDFVHKYRELAQRSSNPWVKFLLEMIVSDEERHYAVMHAMTSTLRGSVNLTGSIQPLADVANADDRADIEALLKLTEQFILVEQEGIDEYEHLSRDSKGYYSGVFVLLLSTLIRDSEKHLEILRFLRRALKAR